MINRITSVMILIFVITLYGCTSPAPLYTASISPSREAESAQVETPTTIIDTSGEIQPTADKDEGRLDPSETARDEIIPPTNTQGPGGDGQVMDSTKLADVISVDVSGSEGAYRLSVGISSPDTGCDQYADWWEVVSQEGELIYRRVLLHSHVEEQPFVRSGGPVAIAPDSMVIVRAHMNIDGYGGAAFQGSVESGFKETALKPDFASDLADELPLPDGCAF